VDAETRGDPMVSIRWLCQSTRGLAKELRGQGFPVSSTKVGQLLRAQGYSLQANRKTVEGKQHLGLIGASASIAPLLRALNFDCFTKQLRVLPVAEVGFPDAHCPMPNWGMPNWEYQWEPQKFA